MSKDLFAGSAPLAERDAEDKREGRKLLMKFRVRLRADTWPERSELLTYARSLSPGDCETLKHLAERLQESDDLAYSGFWQSVRLAATKVQAQNVWL